MVPELKKIRIFGCWIFCLGLFFFSLYSRDDYFKKNLRTLCLARWILVYLLQYSIINYTFIPGVLNMGSTCVTPTHAPESVGRAPGSAGEQAV